MPRKTRTPRNTIRLPKKGDRVRPFLSVRDVLSVSGRDVIVLDVPGYLGGAPVAVDAERFLERTADE